jgi:hypothetical protein
VKIFISTQMYKKVFVLQFELILKIGRIKYAYGGRQKNILGGGARWTGMVSCIPLAKTKKLPCQIHNKLKEMFWGVHESQY